MKGLMLMLLGCIAQIYAGFIFAADGHTIESDLNNPFLPRIPEGAIVSHATRIGTQFSLNVHKMPVRTLLHALAKAAGQNMVVSDAVNGELSIAVHDVAWEHALNIILQTKGLAKRKFDNIWMIAPTADIIAKENLQSEAYAINHAKVADIATLLKNSKSTFLSNRGNVSFDARTNILWVQDTATKLEEVRGFIKQIDVPIKQVLIEARIVSLDKGFEENLGIRFGISKSTDIADNTRGAADLDVTKRLKIDLPVLNAGVGTGAMGLALAKLGNGALLDLELSALESEGYAKIIATPRLLTANQKEALIQAGEEIPYQEATESGGTTVTFKKAVLSLKVVPQITPQGRIILDLTVSQDKRGPEVLSGVPAINTQQIATQVLIDNGQTIVLGGIYQKTYSRSEQRVPFLGALPIIGALFKHTLNKEEQRELLIFVTPKIMNYEQDT